MISFILQKWNDEETQLVAEKFKKFINDGKTPKMKECAGIIKSKTKKQVQDKVRTLIRQKKRKI